MEEVAMLKMNHSTVSMGRRRTWVFTGFFALALAFSLAAANGGAHAQATSALGDGSAPVLTKSQKKELDKSGQNAYKHCLAGELGKHAGETFSGCLTLAQALRTQMKDPAAARKALQRGCSLGSQQGCNELGNDFAAAGDLPSARLAWSAPPCNSGTLCKLSLFDSYAKSSPPNLASAETVGLPLCDQGGDRTICKRLWELGSQADFAAIAQSQSDKRNEKIAELTEEAQKADSDAASDHDEYERLDAQAKSSSGTDALGASMKALVYASSYRSEADHATSLRAQISELKKQEREAQMASSKFWLKTRASIQ
jgi:hypothetical protein